MIEPGRAGAWQDESDAASDLAVAALLGVAALDGAAANVEINLAALNHHGRRAELVERLAAARAAARTGRAGGGRRGPDGGSPHGAVD